jgi:hypothetical protein
MKLRLKSAILATYYVNCDTYFWRCSNLKLFIMVKAVFYLRGSRSVQVYSTNRPDEKFEKTRSTDTFNNEYLPEGELSGGVSLASWGLVGSYKVTTMKGRPNRSSGHQLCSCKSRIAPKS